MNKSIKLSFPRRKNPDGTFDVICPQCVTTVGTAVKESELQAVEWAHNCPGFDLGRLMHSPKEG